MLIRHDTTEIDLTSYTARIDIGPIGDGRGRGFLQQTAWPSSPTRDTCWGWPTSIIFRARDSYAEYVVVVGPNSVATDKKSMQVTVPYHAVTGLVEVVGDRLSHTERLTIT